MTQRKSKFDSTWGNGTPKIEPIDGNNIGHKLLEKMGWSSGLGLGKHNQGLIENPLWRNKRDSACKTGFKCKEERVVIETLPHQTAFENLLGELHVEKGENTGTSTSSIDIPKERVKTSKRLVRYKKQAFCKDINNYSVKDFAGIMGKEVTRKNLELLRDPRKKYRADTFTDTENSDVSETYKNYCGQTFICENSLLKPKLKPLLDSSQEFQKGLKESPCVYIGEEPVQYSEISDQTKTKDHRPASNNCTADIPTVTDASWLDVEGISVTAKGAKAKVPDNKKMRRKKKQKTIKSFARNVDYKTPKDNAESPKSEILSYNSKSISQIRLQNVPNDDNFSETETNLPASSLSDRKKKFPNLITEETEMCQKKDMDSYETPDHSDSTASSSTHLNVNRINNNSFFLSGVERECVKKHLEKNPQIITQICRAFIGSNLSEIKGYGNW